jgi:hypothetical protein
MKMYTVNSVADYEGIASNIISGNSEYAKVYQAKKTPIKQPENVPDRLSRAKRKAASPPEGASGGLSRVQKMIEKHSRKHLKTTLEKYGTWGLMKFGGIGTKTANDLIDFFRKES